MIITQEQNNSSGEEQGYLVCRRIILYAKKSMLITNVISGNARKKHPK